MSSTPSRSPPAAATSAPRKSPSRRGRIDCVSGIAEAAVELEHLRAVRRQHQPREEHADERRAAPRQLFDDRPVDLLDELGDLVGAHSRNRREGAHAAGVRACVPVPDPLEVLRRRKRHDTTPVGEGEDRDLLTHQQLLDHDRPREGGRRAQSLVELLRPSRRRRRPFPPPARRP